MGVYVYAVQKSKKVTVEIDGKKEKVHLLKFTCRMSDYYNDGFYFGNKPKWLSMLHARLARVESSYQKTKYVAIECNDVFEDGLPVYTWDKDTPFWFDTEEPGEKVGTLDKVSQRKYKLIPE